MQKELISDRLKLSLITTDDHAFIKELVNTEGWIKFIGDRNIHNAEEANNYINKLISTNENFYLVVRIKEDLTPIGVITLVKRSYLDHYDLGFAFLPASQGKGYAQEAATLVMEETKNKIHYNTLLAMTFRSNTSSKKLLEILGFNYKHNIKVENDTWELYQLTRK